MAEMSFAPWPLYSEREIDAVARVLRAGRVNYWTGDECRHFEREFAGWCGAQKAVALANGTLALDAILRSVGLSEGDEVIVTPRTFLASVSAVVLAGARPVFADVDRESGNITAASVQAVLSARTKGILCVHLGGWPCDMPSIMSVADEHSLWVVEDCAQAHGARLGERSVGTFGVASAWSFCQDKILTTGGEGGMVTTDHAEMWSRVWSYKDHGKSWSAVYDRSHPPGFRWVHDSFGTNYRMLEVQAAIGREQLLKLAEWTAQRRLNALAIADACSGLSALRVPMPETGVLHAYYRLYAYVRPEAIRAGWSRDRIIAEIEAEGVPCFAGSCPEVYLERAFEGTSLRPKNRLAVAEELGRTSLAFLVHPTLTEDDVERTCATVEAILARAQR